MKEDVVLNRSPLKIVLSLLALLIVLCAGLIAEETDLLSTLVEDHPRLMLKNDALDRLKKLHADDPILRKCVNDVIAAADRACRKAPLVHKLIGPRLLRVSRDCLGRIYALGLAWRWTSDEKYARKVEENLRTVCAFDDWNPSHFLDTAEMSHAVGVGYDWLFDFLDESARTAIRKGLIRNGLEPGLAAYGPKSAWWVRSGFNWNQVCNSGLIIGALAIAESDPHYARAIVPAAIGSLPRAMKTYGPDGAWPEGPGYWNYATSYTVFGLAALESALGNDHGLSRIDGFGTCGFFPLLTTGPSGLFVNFADSGERSRRKTLPCLFWLAQRYGQPALSRAEHDAISRYPASARHLIWYTPPPADDRIDELPLDRCFRGPVELAVFRSAWDDRKALFASVKAGYNQVNHGHLDLGAFEFDALGVRWARDLGSDNYNLPGYWDGRKGGKRWTYYRLNSESHSVPLVDGKGQDPLGTSKIVRFGSTPDRAFAIVDLTTAYADRARAMRRGVALVRNRQALLVQDEFLFEKPCAVSWGMMTDAQIRFEREGRAILSLDGRTLEARVLSPEGAGFAVESAERASPERTNRGVRRLALDLPGAEGPMRIAVLLVPVGEGVGAVGSPVVEPLDEW
jgi:hypothetical protein